MSPEFWITSFVIVATPGTGVIFTLAAALSRGRKASLIAAAGCALGTIPHMLAAITGLATIMHTSALAFQTLKYLGVLYLVYMAWMTIRDKGALQITGDTTPRPAMNVVVSAILVNLLNPKLTIFFVAFLPQFVDPAQPNATTRMIELSIIFALLTFGIFCIYGVIAASVRSQIIERVHVMLWIRRFFAGSFGLLAVRLATTQR